MARPSRAAGVAVTADAEGVQIGGVRLKWSDVGRVDVYKRDVYVGDLSCLLISVVEDRVYEITDESPGWDEVADAIERFLPGALPYKEWAVRLMATDAREALTIFRGSGSRRLGNQ